jgi:hypothetical protein
MTKPDPNDLVSAINDAQYGHLEHRRCTKESPMPYGDEKRYRWSHVDAVVLRPFFNLVVCRCPHCALTFTCLPRK